MAELAALAKEILALKEAKRESDLAARKAAIQAECSRVSGKSVKRTLRHNLESLDLIKDTGKW
jgi:hypothetical protein